MFYTSLGITATEIMTDNSAYYRSRLFHNTLGGITHIFTHPHRPQTNNTYRALSPHSHQGMSLHTPPQLRHQPNQHLPNLEPHLQ
ncbi:MAG: hypothetical protein B5766_00320 [Candidatus Lumbricidophila eiseniae]|uniref:Uncharacterized protein n=1 Tax=Candidatus Lumbricidiphila eiseniae TaxID=1969409 RepID=A0A2A6FVP8_9MICO|nr:MAG: hypothetical protein B5766_00320 [Candidatus Lumbricidophila eiseniae]